MTQQDVNQKMREAVSKTIGAQAMQILELSAQLEVVTADYEALKAATAKPLKLEKGA